MNNSLQNILELSNLDKNQTLQEEKKEAVKINLNHLNSKKDDISKVLQAINEKISNSETSVKRNNIYLKELDEKLINISEKIKKIKTEKEAKALSLEEDIAKEQMTFANDEIKRYEDIVEKAKEDISKENQEFDAINEEIAKEEEEVSKEIKSIERSIKKTKKEKDSLMENIDEKAISFYNKIRQWAGDTSVVPVVDQVCYGCYIQLNDQAYIDILQQDEIKTCPHCGRILYAQKEEESAS